MKMPITLRELAGLPTTPPPLKASVLLIVDAQMEYVNGCLPLAGMTEALRQGTEVLRRARSAGTPVIHIVQHGKKGGRVCDPDGPTVAIADPLTPLPSEIIVTKHYPNSFTDTTLESELKKLGRHSLVIIGFMTHMCVSSTTRAATENGYACTVVARACATRDLPDGHGGIIPAAAVHDAHLAALRDRFAIIVDTAADLPLS